MLAIKSPFKKQQFEAREEAILDAVNRLLSEKGFDLMTMDDVADAVGVAKGSLYKHFSSKEKLAAAAMSRLLSQTLEVLNNFPAEWRAGKRLEEVLRWTLQHRLRGGVPHLPSTRGAFQRALVYTLYARSCDPTLEFLQKSGGLTDDQIVEAMVQTTFGGLRSRATSYENSSN
jgi:AcrR family transcriptional regulator